MAIFDVALVKMLSGRLFRTFLQRPSSRTVLLAAMAAALAVALLSGTGDRTTHVTSTVSTKGDCSPAGVIVANVQTVCGK